MCTVTETPGFIACAQSIWTDDERNAFIEWIASRPEVGDVIPTTKGLRKVGSPVRAWENAVVCGRFTLTAFKTAKLFYC